MCFTTYKTEDMFNTFEEGDPDSVRKCLSTLAPEKLGPGLLVATWQSHLQVMALLLQKGVPPSAKDIDGRTPLHLAAMNGLVAVARVLVEAGADLDSVNKIGQTALIYAVVEEQVEMVRLLIEKGADVNKGNSLHWGWTPLHWAALTDNVGVVEAVLAGEGVRNGKDMTDRYPASLAEEHDKRNVLEMLRKLDKE